MTLLATGCATPMVPTGGPPDRTPPELVTSEPPSDAVSVRTDRITLEFSKPIDEASFQRALAIAPDFETPPHITVRGRRVTILFPEELRENTTYVLTIGTGMQDLRNNRLPQPITLAFATGPQLDEGRIEGWVRDPQTGSGVGGINLFAYLLPSAEAPPPHPRTTAPDYRTEAGSDGTFRFEYLRDAPYFVVAVEDRNRNRRADPGEPFAVPLRSSVRPTTAGDHAPPVIPLYLARADTLAPEPLRIRTRSDTEFAVRFTEPVVLRDVDPQAFAVVDSMADRAVQVRAVFPDEDPSQIVLTTEPMSPVRHVFRLERPAAVTDSAGTPASPRPLAFTPAAAAETPPAEIVAFEPPGADTLRTIRPGESAAVRFTRPPSDPGGAARISVTRSDGTEQPATIDTEDGTRYRIEPELPGSFQVRVRQPDSLHVVSYQPIAADSLGSLTGVVRRAPASVPVVVEAVAQDGYRVGTSLRADSTFVLSGLPAGTYRLRVFSDRDHSERWSGGLLAPYRAPEPLIIVPTVRVRARWETEVDPIVLDPAAAPAPTAAPPATDEPDDERQPQPGLQRIPAN